ncbi:MAG: MBL fold metallo-hydrolase [Acidimicrobiales bacterium]
MGLSLTVLGCDGGYPGPGGATSGYLVRAAGLSVVVDLGHGALANLQLHHDLNTIDAVVLSHEHPDHWADLEGLAVARMGAPERPPLAVYAPGGLRSHVYHDGAGMFDWRLVSDGDRVELGAIRLGFSRTDHGPETLALRVDAEGSSLGYTADTGPDWSLSALGTGLDLGLCEATWLAPDEGGAARHLSARQAGAMASEAGVRRCVLTHRRPGLAAEASFAEGSEAYGSAVDQATIGAVYNL